MIISINRHLYLPLFVAILNLLLFLITIISLLFRSPSYQPDWIRCLLAIIIPSILAFHGLKKQSVDYSGAMAGMIIGMSMILSSYISTVALIVCYLITSKATKFGENIKQEFESKFKKGGQRNWIQIVSNLGAANISILLRLLLYGAGEKRLDFLHKENYWNSFFLLSSIISISAALGDTLSSEIGSVFSGLTTQPFLITTFRRVPRGTNGGVTIEGFIAACIGGFIIGLCSYLTIIIFIPVTTIEYTAINHRWSTPQWPLLHFCLYSGLIGSVLDSLMGATLQYTGYDHRRRRIVEIHDDCDNEESSNDPFKSTICDQLSNNNIEHISGRNIFSNNEINLLMTIIMATIIPLIILPLWPFGFGDFY